MPSLPSVVPQIQAEGVGFEPTRAFTLPVFETGALGLYATLPDALYGKRVVHPRVGAARAGAQSASAASTTRITCALFTAMNDTRSVRSPSKTSASVMATKPSDWRFRKSS